MLAEAPLYHTNDGKLRCYRCSTAVNIPNAFRPGDQFMLQDLVRNIERHWEQCKDKT
jgi:hypothetical protein